MEKAKLKNGLICVLVPKDATNFNKSNHAIGFKSEKWKFDRDCNNWCYISFGIGGSKKLKILGTITKDSCDFDYSVYAKHEFIDKTEIFDLKSGKGKGVFLTPFESFKSMIEKETEFLFENLEGKVPSIDFHTNKNNIKEWKKSQAKVVEKLLILKKI